MAATSANIAAEVALRRRCPAPTSRSATPTVPTGRAGGVPTGGAGSATIGRSGQPGRTGGTRQAAPVCLTGGVVPVAGVGQAAGVAEGGQAGGGGRARGVGGGGGRPG